MKKRISLILCAIATLIYVGCEDENNGPKTSIETGATLTAPMGSDLTYHVYVDLSEGTMTSVDIFTWDLAFENDGEAIRSNTAKKVAIAVPESSDFDEVTTDEGLTYSYDSSDGDLEETALSGWEIDQPYIIDLGLDANGNVLGFKKFMITAKTASTVTIQFADLDGANQASQEITLADGNFTFFSLMNEETVSVEPESWDLVLTAVTLRTGTPCSVLGESASPGVNCDIYRVGASAITNTYEGVEVAVDNPFSDLEDDDDPEAEINQQTIESSNYEAITLSSFSSLGSSSSADAIGRGWFQILEPHRNGIYAVYSFITYIVQDVDGNYYKLRFLAYKGGDNAENGYPTFEYELLAD